MKQNSMHHVILEPLNKNNWFSICKLSVSESQKIYFPIPNIYWIGISRYEENTDLFAIKYKEDYVGLIGGGYDKDHLAGFINPIMVDERFQNQGYAKEAIALMVKHLSQSLHMNKINLGHRKENTIAGELYEKLGFQIVGEDDLDYFRSLEI